MRAYQALQMGYNAVRYKRTQPLTRRLDDDRLLLKPPIGARWYRDNYIGVDYGYGRIEYYVREEWVSEVPRSPIVLDTLPPLGTRRGWLYAQKAG